MQLQRGNTSRIFNEAIISTAPSIIAQRYAAQLLKCCIQQQQQLKPNICVVVVVVVYLMTNQHHMGYLSSGNGHLAGRYSTP